MSKKNILNWQSHGHTCLAFACSHDSPINYTDLDYDFLKFKGDTEIGAPFLSRSIRESIANTLMRLCFLS